WSSFALQLSAIGFGNVGDPGVLAALQNADPRDDGPSVRWLYLLAIRGHQPLAVADRVEDLAGRPVPKLFLMQIGDAAEPMLRGDAVARSGPAVADGAVDIEAIRAALHQCRVHLDWDFRQPLVAHLAAEQIVLGLQKIGVRARRAGARQVVVS